MLTQRQQEIWQFLVEYVDGHGYPPTVREIGEAVGLASPSTVHAHLANLERAGLLRRDPTKPRALELDRHARASGRRRLAGAARPGDCRACRCSARSRPAAPLLAEENVEDEIARARAARPRRRLPPPRQGRLDGRGRDPRRRHARRPPAAGRAERRRRRRARRRRRVRQRGDGEDVLPRERARPPPAGEQRARADLRRPRARSSAR